MARHVWTVVCTKAVTDPRSNNISLIDVTEQLNLSPETPLTGVAQIRFPLTVVSLWIRDDLGRPETEKVRLTHRDVDGMEISGHSSTRVLARYTHPTEERKIGALDLSGVVTKGSQNENAPESEGSEASEIAQLLKEVGGRREARTRDLRIANAALSQLS